MNDRVPIDAELVREFVVASHAQLEKVTLLSDEEPGLVRASIDWGEGDWECGLEAASHMGNRDIALLLLEKGAAMTVFSAAMLGETKLVRAFLQSDPALASRPGVHGISLIYHVAYSGKVEMAELLPPEPPGRSDALHAAVRFGHKEMVAWLLENGADDVNKPNFQSKTPLAAAIQRDELEIAELLRQNGGRE